PPPRLILLSEVVENADLLATALSERAGSKVDIARPQRGEKRDLIDHAMQNAKEELSRRLAQAASQGKLMAALAEAFGLPRPPRRIEVYDNSHISGTNAVGAMIVAGVEGFKKQSYRTFNIKSEDLIPGDDFGMMKEVLERRFSRLMKESGTSPSPSPLGEGGMRSMTDEGQPNLGENPHPTATAILNDTLHLLPREKEEFPSWPDLVLIDGGKGQLNAAREIMAKLGVEGVPLVGIAKGADRDAGRETFFIDGKPPFRLPPRDPALYFVQRLRDEAHRFAIGAHRAKRKRELTKSPLDEIAGIGPARKRALLIHFGTAKSISRASLDDLARAPGVNAATARAVYDFFHEKG
ncbi:MAG: excinuclease ABC subunit UvrC, partial [Beijerinckiaceae bacterium]